MDPGRRFRARLLSSCRLSPVEGRDRPDGRLDAWQEHFITFTADGKKEATGANLTDNLKYSIKAPNLRRAKTMFPLKIPTGAWRAPGDNAQVFAAQSFMHELSLAAGRDHVEFLIDAVNRYVPELAPKDRSVNFSPRRASDVIRMCAEKAGWGRKLPAGSGLGLTWCYSHAGHVAQAVELSVDANKRIKVERIVAVLDVGPIIDMAGSEAQAQGASTDALSTAMGLKINIENGVIRQQNYNAYPILRLPFAPMTIEPYFIHRTTRRRAWANQPFQRWRPRWATPSSPPPESGCGACPIRFGLLAGGLTDRPRFANHIAKRCGDPRYRWHHRWHRRARVIDAPGVITRLPGFTP